MPNGCVTKFNDAFDSQTSALKWSITLNRLSD